MEETEGALEETHWEEIGVEVETLRLYRHHSRKDQSNPFQSRCWIQCFLADRHLCSDVHWYSSLSHHRFQIGPINPNRRHPWLAVFRISVGQLMLVRVPVGQLMLVHISVGQGGVEETRRGRGVLVFVETHRTVRFLMNNCRIPQNS